MLPASKCIDSQRRRWQRRPREEFRGVSILPMPFLVRCRVPVLRIDKLPRSGRQLLDLPTEARLAWPAELENPQPHVELRAAWNAKGLGFALSVTGRTMPVLSNPQSPTNADSFELWIDTRDTQSVHRATRYCHHFCVLPVGGGDDGRAAMTIALPVARAKDDAPLADSDAFLTSSQVSKSGYAVEVWIPAAAMQGFDPTNQPRLGFYCKLNDAEQGALPFSVGEAFPAASDPSLWHTLELLTA
jgi:hypothetical protein